MEERRCVLTLKNVGLSCRELAENVKVSMNIVSSTFKRQLEPGYSSDRNRADRPTAESEDKFLRNARWVTGQQSQVQLNSKLISVSTAKQRLGATSFALEIAARKHQHKTKRKARKRL